MNFVVPTLFQVMSFPHNGKIVTIVHLSFVGPNLNTYNPTSLNVLNMKVVSPPPSVNYLATYHMLAPIDELELLTICSASSSLDPIGDTMNNFLGALEPDLSIRSLDSFQSIVLPSDENLLESMASWGE